MGLELYFSFFLYLSAKHTEEATILEKPGALRHVQSSSVGEIRTRDLPPRKILFHLVS